MKIHDTSRELPRRGDPIEISLNNLQGQEIILHSKTESIQVLDEPP